MDEVLAEGSYLRLLRRGGWEFVERVNATGVAVLVAVTDAGELLLVEQHRPPVGRVVFELPAGLAGDEPGSDGEAVAEAARRELLEETGYRAAAVEHLASGPSSAGLTSEVLSFFLATGLVRAGDGGGVAGERIVTHLVPLEAVPGFLRAQEARGALIDPKVFAALHFARR